MISKVLFIDLAMLVNDEQIQTAESQQEQLRQSVVTLDALTNKVSTIAGVDVAYDKTSNRLVAAVAVLDATSLALLQVVSYDGEATFPYIPGLFSFRELPAILCALKQLDYLPDLLVCDGQGIAHPRRFGIASHLGVETGIPTIGCAKTRLIGEYMPLNRERGSFENLMDNNEIIGRALRTQTDKNPVFVSVGHKISLETATSWILRLSPIYRLPETTRAADHAVKTQLRANSVSTAS